MKIKLVLALLVTLSGCSLTEVVDSLAQPVVSLAIGNAYVYHKSNVSGKVLADWFAHETITGTANFADHEWYRLDTTVLQRADGSKLYSYRNGLESVELDYALSIGDTAVFDGMPVFVKGIQSESVFGTRQKVYELSSKGLSTDTVFTVTYATGFGLLTSARLIGNSVSQTR